MLQGLREALRHPDRQQRGELKRLDDGLDMLNTAIKAYVTALRSEAMTESDHRQVVEILCFATNLEHAGDVVDNGLLRVIAKQIKRGLIFAPAGAESLLQIVDRLVSNLRSAAPCWSPAPPAPPACWSRKRSCSAGWKPRPPRRISTTCARVGWPM
jgi:phosphate:Na+ symporter